MLLAARGDGDAVAVLTLRSLWTDGEHRDLVSRREPGGEQPYRVLPVEYDPCAAQTADVELTLDAFDGRAAGDAARLERVAASARRGGRIRALEAERAACSCERPDLAVLEVEVGRAELD